MAAPPIILVGHCVAMGPPPGLPCLCVVAPWHRIGTRRPFRAMSRCPPSHYRRRTASPERECVAAEEVVGPPGHRAVGAIGPPHRRLTSPTGRSAPSSLTLSSTPSSLHPLRPQRRFHRCLAREDADAGGASPLHSWSSGRTSPPLLCLSPSVSLTDGGKR